jgi:hypothetical protein
MPKYQVLITLNQYRVSVDANNAKEARQLVLQDYMDGNIELDEMPEFFCEEADLLKEEDAL